MEFTNHLDASTLFMVNAVSLSVFAVTYLFAWCGQSNRTYWANLSVSNVLFAIAFIMFSLRINASNTDLLLPNCILVIGLGLRWQAVRVFFKHKPSYILPILLTILVFALLSLESILGTAIVFGGVNVAIALQILAIIHTLISERSQPLPSRWGLAAAYAIILVSSTLRIAQGWILEQGMSSLLPADVFLHIHLFAAAIHIVASGAFSLSMAYEQGTLELRQMALRDVLTGLPNRLGLEHRLKSNFKSGFAGCAVFLIDIDKFKQINDTHGHAMGDHIIHQCGQIISRHLREHDFVARIGGEEFLAIIAHTPPLQAAQIAEHIRQAVESEYIMAGDAEVHFTVSVGIAYTESPDSTFTDLMAQADHQLYKAKGEGRNRVYANMYT